MRATDGGPLALARFDQQRPAHQRDALAHPEQAQPPPVGRRPARPGSKPRPSSSTRAVSSPLAPLDDHADAPRRGVLGDVVQGLLHDPVDRRLDLRRQAVAVQPGGWNSAAIPVRSDHSRHVVGQGRGQADVVQRRGPQLDGQVVHLAADPPDDRLDLAQAGPARVVVRDGLLQAP